MKKRSRKVLYLFHLLVVFLIFLPLPTLTADVVERKTGERMEGTFKEANLREVIIEARGQTFKFQLEKVRPIFVGSAPTANIPNPNFQEAVDSLKALRSVVEAGITYKDYATRVLDTKIKVDRYLQTPSQGDAKAKASVSEAMNYYLLASNTWPDKIKFEAGVINFDETSYLTHYRRLKCKHLEKWFAMTEEEWVAEGFSSLSDTPQKERENIISGRIFKHYLTPSLWSCASDKTLEAESYVKRKP